MEDLARNLSHLMNHRRQATEDGFVALMEKILSPLPGIGWELGPDLLAPETDRLSLSLSQAGDGTRQAVSGIAFPLRGEGWTVGLGIPPRDWECWFSAECDDRSFEVDAGEWLWQFAEKSGTQEVKLRLGIPARSLADASDENLREFANIVVSGELGELNAARWIQSVDVSRVESSTSGWSPLFTLRQKFVERFPGCEYADWLSASRRS